MIELETLTEILPDVVPEIEAVDDGTRVGFYRFKKGKYKGLVYTYANISFKEVGDRLELSFTYVIMQDPEGNQPKTAKEDKKFKNTIGDILVKIIDASVKKQDEKG